MDRRQLTPSKTPTKFSLASHSPDTARHLGNFQLSFIKEYETLKIHTRSLESQNKMLMAEVDRLRLDRQYGESRFIQKINFEQENFIQYQKDKTYHMELIKLKHEQQLNRLRRDKDREIETLAKDIKLKEIEVREKAERLNYLELKNAELSKTMAVLQRQMMASRDTITQLTDKLTKTISHEKTVSTRLNELTLDKQQMEREIHLLLQVDAEKTNTMNVLQSRASKAEASEKILQDKVRLLSQGLIKIEENLNITKDKLTQKESQLVQMHHFVQKSKSQLYRRQSDIKSLSDSVSSFRSQFEQATRREKIREKQALDLIATNERLFSECSIWKHRVYDLAVTYNFAV